MIYNRPVADDPEDPRRQRIGQNVLVLRERQGWDQEELATAAKVSVTTVSRIERGLSNVRWSKIRDVARALHTTLEALEEPGDAELREGARTASAPTWEDFRQLARGKIGLLGEHAPIVDATFEVIPARPDPPDAASDLIPVRPEPEPDLVPLARDVAPIHELRLALTRSGTDLVGTWLLPDRVGVAFTVASPFSGELDAEHRWYQEEFLRWPGVGDIARASAIEAHLDRAGRALFEALQGRERAHPLTGPLARRGCCLLTLISEDADALALPWELMRDERGPMAGRVVIRRQLAATAPPGRFELTLPLRVLLVVARPVDVPFLDPRSSAAPILDALETLGDDCVVEFCHPPTLPALDARLQDARDAGRPYHVVHFDGHGLYRRDRGVGVLCFESATADSDEVPGDRLGALLARHDVLATILEACKTAERRANVFASVAPELLRCGVGSVVAFSHGLSVAASRLLVNRFYARIVRGDSIGQSLDAGRLAMLADPVRHTTHAGVRIAVRDAHVPQLYQAGDDPVPVPSGASRRRPTADRGPPLSGEGSHLRPRYGFRGRARELLSLQRKLTRHVGVVLSGGGGMGKTSLALEAGRWWTRTRLRPDGAVFTSFETRPGVQQVVRALGVALDGDGFLRRSEDAQRGRAVELFREREILWIWDNFESMLPQYAEAPSSHEGGASPLTADPHEERAQLSALFCELVCAEPRPRGWLLVTCRPGACGLSPAASVGLEGLLPSDALELALDILEREGVTLDEARARDRVEDLLAALGHLPLAIELVLPHLKDLTPDAIRGEFNASLNRFTNPFAEEDRNKSLRASLAFSTARLGPDVTSLLPYIACFEGGVFEDVLMRFAEIDAPRLATVRAKLEAVALLWPGPSAERPFMRFHPTLPHAADPAPLLGREDAAQRLLRVHAATAAWLRKALGGPDAGAAMAVVAYDEWNLRRAVELALARSDFDRASQIADALAHFLGRAGRRRDQTALITRVHAGTQEAPQGPPRWAQEREHATASARSKGLSEALLLLESQLEQIELVGDVRERALCQRRLGQILVNAHQPERGLPHLDAAAADFAACGDRDNMAAARGDRTNALLSLGRLDEALAEAEQVVDLRRGGTNLRNLASALARVAQILGRRRRFREAEDRFQQALELARTVKDAPLEGQLVQRLGIMQSDEGRHTEAAESLKLALLRFQTTGNRESEMRTLSLLGVVDKDRGHFEAASAWYSQAATIAADLADAAQTASIAHNRGVLATHLARQQDDLVARAELLAQAQALLTEALNMSRARKDGVATAEALSALARVHPLRGAAAEADACAREGLALRLAMNSPDVDRSYLLLEELADARGDEVAAAEWRARRIAATPHRVGEPD